MDEIKVLRERDESVAMDEERVPKGERSVCWILNGSRRNNEATDKKELWKREFFVCNKFGGKTQILTQNRS